MKLESKFDVEDKVVSRVNRMVYNEGNYEVNPGDWLIISRIEYNTGWFYFCYEYNTYTDKPKSVQRIYKFTEDELMDLQSAIAYFEEKKRECVVDCEMNICKIKELLKL